MLNRFNSETMIAMLVIGLFIVIGIIGLVHSFKNAPYIDEPEEL